MSLHMKQRLISTGMGISSIDEMRSGRLTFYAHVAFRRVLRLAEFSAGFEAGVELPKRALSSVG